MADKKKKPNYFRITSPKVNKLFWLFFSILVPIAVLLLAMCVVSLISIKISEPGMDISSLFVGYDFFMEFLMTIFMLVFLAFASVVVYNYATNRDKADTEKREIEAQSPLLGVAKEHEEQIIECLKSIAKPTKGKSYLRRAGTVQFLRALTELGYMDANTSGANMMAWVEMTTGYKDKDKDSGHFYSAFNNTSNQDTKVLGFIEQIEKIVGK